MVTHCNCITCHIRRKWPRNADIILIHGFGRQTGHCLLLDVGTIRDTSNVSSVLLGVVTRDLGLRDSLGNHLALLIRDSPLQLLSLLIIQLTVSITWHDRTSSLTVSHMTSILHSDVALMTTHTISHHGALRATALVGQDRLRLSSGLVRPIIIHLDGTALLSVSHSILVDKICISRARGTR